MARLTTSERKNLPKSEFAGPGRSFPIPDKPHARKAIQLAPRSERAGNISAGEEKGIVRKARRKLGEGGMSHSQFESMGRERHGKY